MMEADASTVRRVGVIGKGMLVAALVALPHLGGAQGPARWVEESRTTISARTAGADRERTISRVGRYHTTLRGDTLVLHLDDLEATVVADGETTRLDTDPVIGGFWKLVPAGRGWRVVERPFVPPGLAEVSDVARIADDFFPATPPAGVAPGGDRTDAGGRHWQRDGDVAGVHQWHWSLDRDTDTTDVVADSTRVHRTERLRETGTGTWDDAGPRGWTRRIATETEGRFAGRVVRASAVTTVAVRRETIDERR